MYFSTLLSVVLLFASLVVPSLSTPFNSRALDYYRPPLPLPVKVLHQFPAGTWLGSLAVWGNGKILTTALTSPELFQVDNQGKEPVKLVHTFPDATGCTGIVGIGRDVFYVIAGKLSLSGFSTVPGSWSVYRVDVRHHHRHTTKPKPAQVSVVANFPEAILLNGITVLSRYRKSLLISDSAAGVVYRLDAKTGKVFNVLDDPLMKPNSTAFGIGINGLKVVGDVLFFTNSNRKILARIPIEKEGTSRHFATLVANIDGPDDFVFTEAQDILVAQNGADRLGRVTGDTVTTLAGGSTDGTESQLFGPTAVQFGRVKPWIGSSKADWMNVYISTNGGTEQYLTGNVTRGGTISVVDVRDYW